MSRPRRRRGVRRHARDRRQPGPRSREARLAAALLLGMLAVGPVVARGQRFPEDAGDLAAPPPPRPRGQAEDLAAPPPPGPRPPAERPFAADWEGPRVAVGWSRYALADGFGAGNVDEIFLAGWAAVHPVRLSFEGAWGLRDYRFGRSDLLLRLAGGLGYELREVLGPVVPYAMATFSVGFLVAERFTVADVAALGGGGVEIGADLHVYAGLFLGVGLAYQRLRASDTPYDAWALRVRVGF